MSFHDWKMIRGVFEFKILQNSGIHATGCQVATHFHEKYNTFFFSDYSGSKKSTISYVILKGYIS